MLYATLSLLDPIPDRTHIPTIEMDEQDVTIGHEALFRGLVKSNSST